jgi:hypothetical protein
LITTGLTWPAAWRFPAQAAPLANADLPRLRLLADVVLPQEVEPVQRARIAERFLAWVQNYQPGAETDHGYGFPRLRRTPPSPFSRYGDQLSALGDRFQTMTAPEQARAVAAGIEAAKVQRLPARPDGGHVATDLMAFYFNSPEADDLAYRAHIGRDSCRSLAGSEDRPAPLGGR